MPNGYLIACSTEFEDSASGYAAIGFIRLTIEGDTLWSRQYYVANKSFYIPRYGLMQTPSADIIVAGGITGDSFNNLYLMKLDSIGNLQWMKYEGIGFGTYVRLIPGDSSFTVISSYSVNAVGHLYFLRFDMDGNLLTSKGYELPYSFSSVTDALEAGDHSFYILTNEAYYGFARVTRLDSLGSFLWSSIYHNNLTMASLPHIAEGSDHNVYMTQGYMFTPIRRNIDVIKLHEDGSVQWAKQYGNASIEDLNAYDCKTDANGNIIIAGSVQYNEDPSNADFLFVRMDTSGGITDSRVFGMPFPMNSSVVSQTNDHGYMLAGAVNFADTIPYSIYLVKAREDGTAGCDSTIDFNYLEPLPVDFSWEVLNDETVSISTTDAFPVLLTGGLAVTTVCKDSSIATSIAREPVKLPVHIFPNPADDVITINVDGYENGFDLQFLNVMFEELVTIHVNPREGQTIELNVASLPSNMYLVKLTDGKSTAVCKFVKR